MFGYIKIDKPELKIKDYEIYKGIYCSLCKEMGRTFGFFSRFTLSYDFTFLALLKMSINNKCEKLKKSRCSFNPFHKCICCEENNEPVKYSANVAIIMLYYKIKDNIADGNFFQKLIMYIILPLILIYYNKAKRELPEIDKLVFNSMKEQSELENNNCSSIDKASNPTATALGEIFAYNEQDESKSRVLRHLGYCIGRYIYIMDAADDLNDDFKNGRYNTFIYSNNIKDYNQIKDTIKESEQIINRTIVEIINTYSLLEVQKYQDILDNIILDGLNKQKEILFKKEVEI